MDSYEFEGTVLNQSNSSELITRMNLDLMSNWWLRKNQLTDNYNKILKCLHLI